MISIGDDTVVGGDAVLTAHLFENDTLFIAPIRIGKNCMIGAHAILCPGAVVGDGATVGIRSVVRVGGPRHRGVAALLRRGGMSAKVRRTTTPKPI
jgi:acetyltransferase-like isoleucine patch superfamily enzyme